MKTCGKIVLSLVILLSLAGCAIPDPKSPTDSLLVGQIVLQAKDVSDTYTGSSVNGNQKRDIHITLINNETNKEYKLITGKMGFFYILNPEPGRYEITRLEFEAKSSGAWSKIWWQPAYRLWVFPVEPSKISNIGSYLWTFEKIENRYYCTIKPNGSYEELRNQFETMFPKSLWLKHEWVTRDDQVEN